MCLNNIILDDNKSLDQELITLFNQNNREFSQLYNFNNETKNYFEYLDFYKNIIIILEIVYVRLIILE